MDQIRVERGTQGCKKLAPSCSVEPLREIGIRVRSNEIQKEIRCGNIVGEEDAGVVCGCGDRGCCKLRNLARTGSCGTAAGSGARAVSAVDAVLTPHATCQGAAEATVARSAERCCVL
eukprot:Hpha_TRINITY_DN14447_c0_g1::TRINITY_DN14447_c0_g1_i1::g.157210::m.157210